MGRLTRKTFLTRRLERKIRIWGRLGYLARQEDICSNTKGSDDLREERDGLGEDILQELVERLCKS